MIDISGVSMKARQRHPLRRRQLVACSALAALCASAGSVADAAQEGASALRNGTIGYVLTDMIWSVYETPGGKTECPDGLNAFGPREQFEVQHPKNKKRTLIDTQLAYEARTWYPSVSKDPFPFHEAVGPSYGLNLDGKVGPNDFTHPDGTPGIDNQLYRAIGCLNGYRIDGLQYIFLKHAITKQRFTRFMIELSGVDDLRNDPDVQVTIYRGLDRLLTDATGDKIVPGGSQRIDTRWGADLIQQVDGQIVEGVLTTKPTAQMVIPWNSDTGVPTRQIIRDMRVQLTITPTGAQGVIGGYADVETWYTSLIRADSTHHLSNGQVAAPSLYNVLHRLADAHPDPETGSNTAISSSLDVKFTQVFIQHPQGAAAKAELLRSLSERSEKTAALAN
jgi:hypothetical protein